MDGTPIAARPELPGSALPMPRLAKAAHDDLPSFGYLITGDRHDCPRHEPSYGPRRHEKHQREQLAPVVAFGQDTAPHSSPQKRPRHLRRQGRSCRVEGPRAMVRQHPFRQRSPLGVCGRKADVKTMSGALSRASPPCSAGICF
jgi:hypothetical protein